MKSFLALAALPLLALAKTDLEGCTSSATVKYGGASLLWWDPTNGEICSFLDCGGGRAPPKTTVPGCGGYSGTATYTPDYIPGWGPAGYTGKSSAEGSQATSGAVSSAGVSSSSSSLVISASETASGSTLITSAATLPSSVPAATGTGGLTGSSSVGGNNVTGTATPSAPIATGAAALPVGVAPGVLGVVAGVVGMAML